MPIRVLLADDHAIVREGIKSLLEREGFQIAGEACDGHELLQLAVKLPSDIAIVDASMPILNGIEAARELRKCSPRIKTILLTRHDEQQYVTEALHERIMQKLDIHETASLVRYAVRRGLVQP